MSRQDAVVPAVNRREEQRERQRRRLLLAAGETFVKRGYANSTVAHVLQHAGMSRRSFYEMFDNKEDALLALLDEMIEEVQKEVARRVATGDNSPFEIACHLLGAYLSVASRFPVVGYQVMALGGEPRARRKAQFERLLDLLMTVLGQAHQQGTLAVAPDPTTLRLLVGGLDQLVLSYHLDGNREALPENEPVVRELLRRAFGGQPEPLPSE